MSEPIVYASATSPFGRSVRICLLERGIRHQVIPLTRDERKLAVNLARHPFAKVPVLNHDGFIVYETQAIIRYVAEIFPGEPLTPADPRSAARMNQIIGIIDAYFFNDVSLTIAGERMGAKMTGRPVNEEKILAALPNAHRCLSAINAIHGGRPFLAGDHFSLADIMAGPHLRLLELTPEGQTMLPEFPGLRRWLAEMNERASFRETEPPAI